MADTYTGTNTDKIEKLITDIVEVKTTLRLCAWVLGTSLPFLVGLNAFMILKTFDNSAKIDRLGDRIEQLERGMERRMDRIQEHLDKSRKPA